MPRLSIDSIRIARDRKKVREMTSYALGNFEPVNGASYIEPRERARELQFLHRDLGDLILSDFDPKTKLNGKYRHEPLPFQYGRLLGDTASHALVLATEEDMYSIRSNSRKIATARFIAGIVTEDAQAQRYAGYEDTYNLAQAIFITQSVMPDHPATEPDTLTTYPQVEPAKQIFERTFDELAAAGDDVKNPEELLRVAIAMATEVSLGQEYGMVLVELSQLRANYLPTQNFGENFN